jgi:hypothetical protein
MIDNPNGILYEADELNRLSLGKGAIMSIYLARLKQIENEKNFHDSPR